MEKNGLLQTFFYDFLKIQVTNYRSFEEMKKGTSAIHGATFFFYQKGHGAQKKGHGVMKKGHGAAPFYFSLDKTLITYECHDNAPWMWKVVQLEKYFDFSLYSHHFSLLSLTSLLSAPEREVTSPSDF